MSSPREAFASASELEASASELENGSVTGREG